MTDKVDKAEKMYKDYKGKRVVCGCTHVWQTKYFTGKACVNEVSARGEYCHKCNKFTWYYNKRGAFQKYKRRDV